MRIKLLLLLFILISASSFGQTLSRDELEQQKKENLEKIKTTQNILNQTRKQRTNSVGELRALNRQIASQEQQLYLMEQDLTLIESELKGLDKEAINLEMKLKKLRAEYADMVYRASKTSGRINQLSFMLSSSSFNQLVMRYKYIQQYTDNRKQQIEQIKKVTGHLTERQSQLAAKKTSQITVKQQKLTEAQRLAKLKQEKSQVVSGLSKKEKELRSELAAAQRSIKTLNNRISSVIAREVTRQNKLKEDARREDARRLEAASAAKPNPIIIEDDPSVGAVTTPTEKVERKVIVERKSEVSKNDASDAVILLGANFAANQRRIPWPVKSGFISDKFGVKSHPVLKGVMVDNNGVTIQTSENAAVQSVFEGTVMDVTDIPGLNKVVAIQHGEYFTVYANLQQVYVSTNQRISAREAIGSAATKDGVTEINFQVWKNTSRLNPELWLVRK